MASNPPEQCCTVGVRHEGQTKGQLKQIGGNEYYVATATGSNVHEDTAILIITDVIGHSFVNAQLIADQFAANGYMTYVPDVFNGDPIPLEKPPGFEMQKWLKGEFNDEKKPHDIANTEPLVHDAIKYLRQELGVKRLAGVGYCFGAKYVIRNLVGSSGIDVGYVAHPSMVEYEELEKIKGPLSIAACQTDAVFTVERRHNSEEILRKGSNPWQINLFSGAQHGFAVRGDISKPDIKFAKEQAFYQAVQWFDKWL